MKITILSPGAVLAFTLSLLFASTASHADDGYLVFNTLALHFENADERNAVTPGIGWEYSPSNSFGYHIGTLSDSFGYQAMYGGINYATPRFAVFDGKVRFLLGATILHKQYHKDSEPDTKLVPLPAVEFALSRRAVLNLSGSPQVDYNEHHNNAVVFLQFKLNLL